MYTTWKACLRVGMRPPGVPESWDKCGVVTQALVLAFHQVCEHEESERDVALAGARKV